MTFLNDYFDPNKEQANEIEECLANSKQIFKLIDGILPLELCLHYEILPLELINDRLTLGMVNLEDENALDLVRPIATSLGYSLDLKSIGSQTHQLILASYLQKPNSSRTNHRHADSAPTIIGKPDELPPLDRRHADFAPTIIGRPDELPPLDRRHADFAPTIIGRPDELLSDRSLTPTEIPSNFDLGNIILESPNLQKPAQDDSTANVSAKLATELSDLSHLTPRQIWQRLYQKLLDDKIDRLDLKSNNNLCQIIGSYHDAIELSWEEVPLSVFTDIANEIKAIIRLAPVPLEKPKKAVVEKRRDGERVLLRIELTPALQKSTSEGFSEGSEGKGEEITLTAKRGKALQFHEQKQMDKMNEQALLLAHKLENVVRKMRLGSSHAQPKNLSELKALLTKINNQLKLENK